MTIDDWTASYCPLCGIWTNGPHACVRVLPYAPNPLDKPDCTYPAPAPLTAEDVRRIVREEIERALHRPRPNTGPR